MAGTRKCSSHEQSLRSAYLKRSVGLRLLQLGPNAESRQALEAREHPAEVAAVTQQQHHDDDGPRHGTLPVAISSLLPRRRAEPRDRRFPKRLSRIERFGGRLAVST